MEELDTFSKMEKEGACVLTTARIFRQSVSIPDKDITSEHSLDHVLTNYVIGSTKMDLYAVLPIFKQYEGYRLCEFS